MENSIKSKVIKLGQTDKNLNGKFKKALTYTLPEEITKTLDEVEDDIRHYQLFMSDNRIYILRGKTGKEYFDVISNFEIKILQHIQDEKFPMKLLRIKNVFNHEKIFDLASDLFNTLGSFENSIARQGNFLFTGTTNDFKVLKAFLFDKMGNGQKIECLGYQKGFDFWVWNNKVNLLNGSHLEIDDNGIFNHNNKSFYVPSANKIYLNNTSAFQPQKKLRLFNTSTNLNVYLQRMKQVYFENSITAMLFTISTIFRDIVADELGNFPLLFLYGKGSTGKDQLADCCQSFFGSSQNPINLQNGASTLKGQIRKFAQFHNLPVHLSEYRNGDLKLDGLLKGLWDLRGYEFGTTESKTSTDNVPVFCSTILTGNFYPDDEALISRLIWLEFEEKLFTTEEVKNYNELKDITKEGISNLTDFLLQYRKVFKDNFKNKYRMCSENLKSVIEVQHTRVLGNLCVLAATYEIFKDIITFPFTSNEMIDHFKKCTDNQTRKLKSSSIGIKFWDCFLASLRGNRDDRNTVFRDLRLDGNNLHFNFTSCWNKIQRQWALQYRENAPSKDTIVEYLKKESYFTKEVSSIRFAKGKDAKNTSAYLIDISKLQIEAEIVNAIEWQIVEQSS
jgi:hypothetical protein